MTIEIAAFVGMGLIALWSIVVLLVAVRSQNKHAQAGKHPDSVVGHHS